MIVHSFSLRCAGQITAKAGCGAVIGMGIARPQRTAERVLHRPNNSNPRTVTDGSERAKQRQKSCSHWTRGFGSPAAAHGSPSKAMKRCRQVAKASEVTAMGRQPDPAPRTICAAASMVCNGSASARLSDQHTLSRRRAKCAQTNPSPLSE